MQAPHASTKPDADVFVIGAGPAGLTAAYCLTKENPSVLVIEKDPVYVGGISRTVEYNGFMFDIGGRRLLFHAGGGGGPLARIPPPQCLSPAPPSPSYP